MNDELRKRISRNLHEDKQYFMGFKVAISLTLTIFSILKRNVQLMKKLKSKDESYFQSQLITKKKTTNKKMMS